LEYLSPEVILRFITYSKEEQVISFQMKDNFESFCLNSRVIYVLGIVMAGLLAATADVRAQPGPLEQIQVTIPSGDLTNPSYTPFAMSYYPFHEGVANDSICYIFEDQLVSGTSSEADRLLNVNTGTYAYRNTSGEWSGSLTRMQNGHAFYLINRHEARTIMLEGFPADSFTYISPMPNGTFRLAAPRMLTDHPIDSVGFVYSGFHSSENMREGGDIVIDMVTRQITRLDNTDGWIGTMTHLRVGQPIIVQVNHPLTFDWTYFPGHE
jgi:hypothetical protein